MKTKTNEINLNKTSFYDKDGNLIKSLSKINGGVWFTEIAPKNTKTAVLASKSKVWIHPSFLEGLHKTEILHLEKFTNTHDKGKIPWIESYYLKELFLPDDLEEFDIFTINNCKHLEKIYISEENKYFKTIDDCLYSKDGKILYYVPVDKKEVYLPDTVEEIKHSALTGFKDKVRLSNNLVSFEGLKDAELTVDTIYIPDSVKQISVNINARIIYASDFVSDNCKINYGNIDYEGKSLYDVYKDKIERPTLDILLQEGKELSETKDYKERIGIEYII